MSKKMSRMEELVDKIQEIDNDGEDLTKWEIDFIASFIDSPPRHFTVRQEEIINRIYNQRVAQ